MTDPTVARAMWRSLEPYHAVVYFAPEARTAYQDIGLKGYWMGYFASRAAAFGAVGPDMVIATFYNFAPRMVRRALPDAWTFSTPERALAARHNVVRAAVARLPGIAADDRVVEAADLAERAARTARIAGRPLAAAHMSLPWPDEPRLRLWHAATVLREHRGDAHIAVLLAEQIDGCESHLLGAAAGAIDPTMQRDHRGWSDEEWAAAGERLRRRGLLDVTGMFTDEGRTLKERLEFRTDELSAQPYDVLGPVGCARLAGLVGEIIGGSDAIPFPNAMGLTKS